MRLSDCTTSRGPSNRFLLIFFLALTGWMNGRDPLKTARETNGGGTAGAGALLSLAAT